MSPLTPTGDCGVKSGWNLNSLWLLNFWAVDMREGTGYPLEIIAINFISFPGFVTWLEETFSLISCCFQFSKCQTTNRDKNKNKIKRFPNTFLFLYFMTEKAINIYGWWRKEFEWDWASTCKRDILKRHLAIWICFKKWNKMLDKDPGNVVA